MTVQPMQMPPGILRRRFDLRSVGRRVFGGQPRRRLYLLVAAGLFVVIAWGVCTVYVRPNEFAVKQVTVGRHKGILPEVYYPGLHFVSPGTERLHVFPTDIQSLDLSNDPNERPKDDKRVTPAINIQTSEGYTVTVDLSVLYRIEDPYKVLTTIGPGKLYEDALIIPRTEQILRKRLGELDAEEFYDVAKRSVRARAAREELNLELVPNGIRVTHIFLRRYVYDARYQAAIEQRKIQDQTVFKNIAEAELAAATAERDRVVALGQAAVKVELARGEAEKRKLEAEGDLYSRRQRAAGELAVSLAEAEGTRLENEALRGVGSENLVGLRMAEVLRGTKIIVVPTDGESGVNPLDLRSALRRFDVKGGP
jgi:regulator of protease activity HflC (stomatin/prohibitin superfamily)